MIGTILGNLQEAAKKGWLTPKQAEALNFFLQTREPQTTNVPEGQAASGHGTDAQGGGTDQDEYQQFYQGMIEADEKGPGQSSTPQAYYYPTGGSSSTGGGTTRLGMTGPGGGTARLGMTGPGGGGSTGSSGTAPAGGFAPPPPPPPPPPPGPGMGGGGTPYDEYMNKLPGMMQTENDYLNNNFSQGDPFYGWFQNLFGSENWYRDFSAKSLTELQAIKGAKDQIMSQLAGIDASTPDGAKKLYMLQQKLSDVQQSERQIYDGISSRRPITSVKR
jgi:hypothetical protein